MEKCSCERCAFESEHLHAIFRDAGVDGIVELVKKHNYHKSYCEFVLLVWFLMNKTDHSTVTVSTWSAVTSKIEKAAALQSLPLRSYWAMLAAQSVTSVCPEMFSSPFVHGLLVHELGKYTDAAVKKSFDMNVDVFEDAILSTIEFLVSYIYAWHPRALELAEGIDASILPMRRMMTPRTDLFDRAFSASMSVFVRTLLLDVTLASTSPVYTGQLLFILRAIRDDIIDNMNSPLRESMKTSSTLFGGMYHIAFDPECMPIESAFEPHRHVIGDIVVALTTGSRETFLRVVRNDQSEFISVKSFMLMTKLTHGMLSAMSVTDLKRIFREIESLRKTKTTEEQPPAPTIPSDTPDDGDADAVLDKLIDELEEEEKASDARRQKKREKKRDRKDRKNRKKHPPNTFPSTQNKRPECPERPEILFTLPRWTPVDDEVYMYVRKNPWF